MVTETEQLHNACGGTPCLDFVNSAGRTPEGLENERLRSYEHLLLWSTQAGLLPERRARQLAGVARERPAAAQRVVERARDLREVLFRLFAADIHGRRPARADVELLNAELAKSLARARVGRGAGGYDWTWCQEPDALDAPLWPLARSAAELLISPDLELVKECASDTCLWLFLDQSRNHKRRWCEMSSCGNRAKVRKHRSQRR